MNIFKKIAVVIFALVLTLLDVSFFSAMPIHDATIVTTFLFAMIFALLLDNSNYTVFVIASVICFAAFSSLPAWLLIISFFLLPELILFLRSKFIPEPTVVIAFFFFVVGSFVFEFLILLYAKEFSGSGFTTLGYFILINSIAGAVLYFFSKKIRNRLKIPEVKI